MTHPVAIDLLPSFIRKRVTVTTSGCWEWSGWRNNLGYGYIRHEGRDRPVHRVLMELMSGPFTSGIDIDHLCKNPCCLNPAHLEAVTHRENIRRGKAATKTTCKRGHDLTNPKNVYRRKNGKRWCAECHRTIWNKGAHV